MALKEVATNLLLCVRFLTRELFVRWLAFEVVAYTRNPFRHGMQAVALAAMEELAGQGERAPVCCRTSVAYHSFM